MNGIWRSMGAAATACMLIAGCGGGGSMTTMGNGMAYATTGLVSDTAGSNPYGAVHVDANLVNAWGVAFNPQGFAWVANEGTSTSTLYDGNGVRQTLVVTLPAGAHPTGIAFNNANAFAVSQNGATANGVFIFATLTGTIAAWAPTVNATAALTVVDHGATGSVYTGLALATAAQGPRLYAADFAHGRVDVFDGAFTPLALPAGAFSDANLPTGYAPFGIQAIGNLVYVAYAKFDPASGEPQTGAGLGALDVYDTAGTLQARLVAPGGPLNAPWGVALAPAGFGRFGGALLVGNFGDGRIHAFDPANGMLEGALMRADGSTIAIDGLWGIAFGNNLNAQPANTLFFAAGPVDETHGAYGRIDVQ